MESLEAFEIDLRNLKHEENVFDFRLDDQFFKDIESQDIHGGTVGARVVITKVGSVYDITLDARGTVTVTCDRCLEDMTQPISTETRLYARLGDERGEDGDTIIVPAEDGTVNMAWNLYEMVALAVPARHVHDEGDCDPAMTQYLKKWAVDEPHAQAQTDPRWKDLEKLKTIIKD